MDRATLRKLLENVRKGTLSPARALDELARLPFETAGPALVDHHRALRQHLPEVILGQGKTVAQCVTIARAVVKKSGRCLATRVSREQAEALIEVFEKDATWNEVARVVAIETKRPGALRRKTSLGGKRVKAAEPVLVISAGTSDVPVAEEAVATLEFMGVPVTRVYDAGVAGIHRLVAHVKALRSAAAIVVVAGMEGALASVVAGLTDRPVIAVPTSVGYGASYGGLAALLAMLNSCVAGVTVVNIDNGFGAGYAAGVIARRSKNGRRPR
jgi:NCAIR mutase (PurE)-related protein